MPEQLPPFQIHDGRLEGSGHSAWSTALTGARLQAPDDRLARLRAVTSPVRPHGSDLEFIEEDGSGRGKSGAGSTLASAPKRS